LSAEKLKVEQLTPDYKDSETPQTQHGSVVKFC